MDLTFNERGDDDKKEGQFDVGKPDVERSYGAGDSAATNAEARRLESLLVRADRRIG
jgi:hypothetical protein